MTTTATRRLAALTVIAAACTLPAIPATAAKSKAPLCEQRAGSMLDVSGRTRLFSTFTPSKSDPDAGTLRIISCVEGKRTARVLFKRASNLDSRARVSGAGLVRTGTASQPKLGAVALDFESGVATSTTVFLWDVTTGKEKARSFDCGVSEFRVTRTGAFAFLSGVNGRLVTVDGAGRVERSAGPVTDVATAGSTVYWTESGAAKSVALSGTPSGESGESVSCG